MEFCCTNCFFDEWLIGHIKIYGKRVNKCDFCGDKNNFAININEFEGLISPIVGLYTAITNFYPMELLKEGDHSNDMIWDKLTNDWGIFNTPDIAENILSAIYQDDPREGTFYDFMNDAVAIEEEWSIEHYTIGNLWNEFCVEIKHQNRFNPKSFNKEMINLIISANIETILTGNKFYRARIQRDKKPYKLNEMGAPAKDLAIYGRINPQGIPYLYLSENEETSISEIRPNILDKVNLAIFELEKDIKVIDLRNLNIGSPFRWGDNLKEIYLNQAFLNDFSATVSKPINFKTSYLEYLPTQFVSEYIKNRGFDGIIYPSSVCTGYNIALFNEEKCKCISVKKVDISTINYKFSTS